ncbi:hypothetical protein [Chlorogloeopsis fritschii]
MSQTESSQRFLGRNLAIAPSLLPCLFITIIIFASNLDVNNDN